MSSLSSPFLYSGRLNVAQAAHPYLASTGLAQKHPSGLFNKVEPNSDVFILCGSN